MFDGKKSENVKFKLLTSPVGQYSEIDKEIFEKMVDDFINNDSVVVQNVHFSHTDSYFAALVTYVPMSQWCC